MRDKLIARGLYPPGATPEQFDARVRSGMAKYAKVIKEAGIQVE